MSTVPYIFADDYGNIPLSYLDANFANVKANVDYATAAGSATTALTATTAATVTTNAQPNITSIGTLSSLTVSGVTSAGNVSAGNITASGNVTIAGTLTAGNIKYTSNVFVGDLKGSVYADDSTIIVDAIDNSVSADSATFGTVSTTGTLTAAGNTSVGNITISNRLINNGLEIVNANVVVITGNAETSNLSPTVSYNILFPNAAGYTHTINMPESPVNGQLTKFSITGNALTLAAGTGTLNTSFAGLANVGTSYVYMYRTTGNIWIKTA